MKKYYKLLSNRLLKIYISYILLFTITAYSACLIYVRSDYKRLEQKRIEQLVLNLENYLSYSVDITQTLSLNDDIIKYSQNSDEYDWKNILNVKNQLSSISFINNSFTSIALTNVKDNHIITSKGSTPLSYFISEYGLDNSDIMKNLEKLYGVNTNNNILMTVIPSSDAQVTPYIISLFSYRTQKDNPIVFITLFNLYDFFSSLPEGSIPTAIQLEIDKNNLYISYDKTKDNIICFTKPEIISSYKHIADAQTHSNMFGTIKGTVFAPKATYTLHINSFFILLIIFLIAMFFIGHIFIKNSTKLLYSPIKKLLGVLPNNLANSSNEFYALENYVTSLVSQKNIMTEIISENKVKLIDKFIVNLLTSTLSNTEIKDGIISYELQTVKFPAVAFVITYRNYSELKNILSIDGLNEIRISIHEYFDSTLKTQNNFFKLIDIDQQTIAGISTIKNLKTFFQELKQAALSIEMMMDIDLVIYIGTTATTWHELSASYSSAINTKNKYLIISDQNIVISANETKYSQTIDYSLESESQIISGVISGNTNLAIEHINKIIDTNMENTVLTREYYSQLVIMLYSTITKLLTIINKTEKELFDSVSIYLELISCSDGPGLKAKMTSFVTAIISNIENTQKLITDNTTNRILLYIHEHYKDDISLFTLADYLNVSQTKASRMFKAHTGENFKDFLANYRIEKAIELMKKNPAIKLNKVAEDVGYSNRTFTRVFQNKYGITPSEYVKKI